MAGYLLDSDTIVALIKGSSRKLESRLATLAATRVHLSAIVLAELRAGAEKSSDPARASAALTATCEAFSVADFDADAALHYGRLRAALERRGKPIGPMDMLIAAQAVSRRLTLVTGNTREFNRVPGLTVENWLR